MAIILKITLKDEAQTQQLAERLADCIGEEIVIYLKGDLGSGKTALARGFIQYFGFDKVKSPTYSLVESYQNKHINIHHFDCYRLNNPEELNYIGIREYTGIQLIEWPDLGRGVIAPADLTIKLNGENAQRNAVITAHTQIGRQLFNCIKTLS